MVIGAQFGIRASDVTGCLVLVLGLTSLRQFVDAVDLWAERTTGGNGR